MIEDEKAGPIDAGNGVTVAMVVAALAYVWAKKPAKEKEKAERRWLVATLPDGRAVRQYTQRSYAAVLCISAPARKGDAASWAVVRWSKHPKRLEREKKLLEEQYLGARKLVVVTVTKEDRMFTQTRITKKQREALELLVVSPRSTWDFGSTTVHVLRLLELIEKGERGTIRITDAGRARLAEETAK